MTVGQRCAEGRGGVPRLRLSLGLFLRLCIRRRPDTAAVGGESVRGGAGVGVLGVRERISWGRLLLLLLGDGGVARGLQSVIAVLARREGHALSA